LYDWFLDQIYDSSKVRPKQREFARRNLSHTVVSKRKLLQLVKENHVHGWDDPRMSTISGLRRRGYTPASLRNFTKTIGIAKRDNLIDVSVLEFCIREDLNKIAPRVMAVLDPVKLIITNYPDDQVVWLDAENNPEDEAAGSRKIPFSRVIYIEREDFLEEAPAKFFRLSIGKEVRLKNAYIIKGESVVKDAQGNITEINATYDPESLSGSGTEASQRKVSGTLHWVSVAQAIPAEVRLYDRLFVDEAPDSHKEKDFLEFVNPNSLQIVTGFVEPSLQDAAVEDKFQFQRLGYFTLDKESTSSSLVFNKTVGLKDAWEEKGKKEENAITNSLKELNKYFKAATEAERADISAQLVANLQAITNFSLLQNTIKKNLNNTKASLLLVNLILHHTTVVRFTDLDQESIQKLVSLSFASESAYVRLAALHNLNNHVNLWAEFLPQIQALRSNEKDLAVQQFIDSIC
jgi:glutaminyl-tRNA synthetase